MVLLHKYGVPNIGWSKQLMYDSLQINIKNFLKRLEQLENLPEDDVLKKNWKSGEISTSLAIYLLEFTEELNE